MTLPFVYPAGPHVRRHGPAGYADHASYRPWLRDEFAFRCVYCLRREAMGQEFGEFAVDHFLPVKDRPDLATEYTNLLYVCVRCNLRKRERFVADPLASPPPLPPTSGGASTPRAFAGIHEADGYTGVVNFKCSAFVGVMDLNGAASSGIAQNDAYQYTQNQTGGQISVTQTLTWNAGSINAGTLSNKAAYFNLVDGANGNANPQGGNVKLGSTVTVLSGVAASALTVRSGSYTISFNGGFVAAANAALLFAATPSGQIVIDGKDKTDSGPVIEVKANGNAEVTCDRPAGNALQATVKVVADADFKVALFVNAGTTKIHNRTTLQIGDTVVKEGSGYSQDVAGAKTVLEAGSRIKCVDKGNVSVSKGDLEVRPITVGGVTGSDQPEAVIDTAGVVLGSGTTTGLTLDKPATLKMTGSQYVALRVEGAFLWLGEVKIALARDTTASDKVIVTKDIQTVALDAKLTLRWGDPDIPLQNPPAKWVPVSSVDGKVLALPQATNVTKPAVSEFQEILIDRSVNEKKLEVELRNK